MTLNEIIEHLKNKGAFGVIWLQESGKFSAYDAAGDSLVIASEPLNELKENLDNELKHLILLDAEVLDIGLQTTINGSYKAMVKKSGDNTLYFGYSDQLLGAIDGAIEKASVIPLPESVRLHAAALMPYAKVSAKLMPMGVLLTVSFLVGGASREIHTHIDHFVNIEHGAKYALNEIKYKADHEVLEHYNIQDGAKRQIQNDFSNYQEVRP